MRHFERILAAIIIVGALCSCETVNSDGSVSRIDADAVNAAVNTGFGVWDRVRAQQNNYQYQPYQLQPQPYITP